MPQDCESQDDACDHEYWHIAEAEVPLLIDTAEKLNTAADIICKALVVGLDSEWPPKETGHRPSSTVLQLACWEPSQGLVVLVLVGRIDKVYYSNAIHNIALVLSLNFFLFSVGLASPGRRLHVKDLTDLVS
jgi:hypothetical protein